MRVAARTFLDATDVEPLDREAGWTGQLLGCQSARLGGGSTRMPSFLRCGEATTSWQRTRSP